MIGRQMIWLAVILAVGACEIPLGSKDAESAINDNDFSIVTSSTQYDVSVLEDQYPWIEADIPSVYTNRLEVPVFFIGCRPPHSPRIQRSSASGWVTVYDPVQQLCLSPAKRVLPGESIELPSLVIACFPDENCGPEFHGPIAGSYRLLQDIYLDSDGRDAVPEAHRVSNSFELTTVAE